MYSLCAVSLETATVAASNGGGGGGGGGGNTPPAVPAELAVKIVESSFQKCAVEKLDQLLNQYSSTSSGGGSESGGIMINAKKYLLENEC